MNDEYHVLPVDDIIEHDEDDDCMCGPRVDLGPGTKVVVHHSLDGRELAEA